MDVTFTESGRGRPFLLLHGGGGPQTVIGFADRLAAEHPARVITPTHPGFGGTDRPAELTTIAGLAELYVALLDRLDLREVAVVGNSIGGWIAAEMALLDTARIASVTLVDAVGIEVPGHPVVDFFALTFPEIAQRSYYEPARFLIDPGAMTPQQQAVLAGNREALAVYAGKTSMMDPTLAPRLSGVTVPVRVIWGDHDRIADPDYGRAYAEAIPGAEFVLLPETGHLPQLESPERLIPLVWDASHR
ncbi:alpha/beta fold hydrolase [Pseudosporangium ferrugineum]|uniref:Pimeloyl-ACP methyl ester carboxylesterase n=1 Tax=Pseudosporangium ferrugineum TaxID=439699 RepID=A0A2T0S3S1_9ACTN|nr:alpha/beta hydrolase [Pseudosporangium ferrugineum]PRY28075.1 pimeloyl-ACP methyl ester carboxylesterase [Pseudosporangium ferrugineum]